MSDNLANCGYAGVDIFVLSWIVSTLIYYKAMNITSRFSAAKLVQSNQFEHGYGQSGNNGARFAGVHYRFQRLR